MTLTLFTGIEQTLVSNFGSLIIVALGIIAMFTIAFLMLGVDFRLVMLIDTILIIGFSRTGWIPAYVEGVMWIGIVGLGLYMLWSYIGQR